jgi:replicative DNA helicase
LSDLIQDQPTAEQYMLHLSVEDFSSQLRRDVFLELRRAFLAGEHTDTGSLGLAFRANPKALSEALSVAHSSPSAANAEPIFRCVRSMTALRRTHEAIDYARAEIAKSDADGVAIASDIEKRTADITLGACDTAYRHIKTTVAGTIGQIETYARTKGAVDGIEAPFPSLNEIMAFRNSEFIIIGARPSVGKTAFTMSLIEDICFRRKIPTGMFSVEMTIKQLNLRAISAISGVMLFCITGGMLEGTMPAKVTAAAQTIYDSPFFVDDTNAIKISELRTKARRMVRVDGVRIIFIDYLSLVDDEQPRIPRHEQMADISRKLKALAKELNIPVVALSQIVRESEGKRPTLKDLRESGALEQDADTVIFLHRERE